MADKGRQVYGNPSVFRKCRTDKKFAYVVALARAVNALTAAHSLMLNTKNSNSPGAIRDRMNASFFISGILYETLKLIRAMNVVFKGNESFETSLRLILRDASGQALEQMHLKSVRHGGVFHFLPEQFAKAISKTPLNECVFLSSDPEENRGSLHYQFADLIAAEMMVGGRLDDAAVVNEMMRKTLDLVQKLIGHSGNFIADQLHVWGFEIRLSSSSTPASSQSTVAPSK